MCSSDLILFGLHVVVQCGRCQARALPDFGNARCVVADGRKEFDCNVGNPVSRCEGRSGDTAARPSRASRTSVGQMIRCLHGDTV